VDESPFQGGELTFGVCVDSQVRAHAVHKVTKRNHLVITIRPENVT
jgi:hypothetical protein